MNRLPGLLLCTAALVLYVGAALSLLAVKSLVFAPRVNALGESSGTSPGEMGLGVGAILLSVLLALVGAKIFKAGRARLTNAVSVHA